MFKHIMFVAALITGELMGDTSLYPTKGTTQDTASFEKKMDEAIGKQEQYVQRAQANATTHENVPTWNTKLEWENAALQLEVKKTLVNNFKNTDSLKSALVQQKLLSILNKDFITVADLADLQSLVVQEKTRMRAEGSSAQTTNPTEYRSNNPTQPQNNSTIRAYK